MALSDKATIDEIVASKLAPTIEELTNEVEIVRTARLEVEGRADELKFGNIVAEAFMRTDGNPAACEFITLEARECFEFANGQVVARPGRFSTLRPWDALTLDEWLDSTKISHSFAYKRRSKFGDTKK